MTSTAQPASNSVNVPSANSPSVAQGSQRPPSYANATKGKQLSPPANSPLVVGGLASSQHAPQHSNTASPVNGRPSVPPAVPSAGPAIVNSASIANGTPIQSDHNRKPSVTISAQGTSGYANGSAAGSAVRPPVNLQFGQLNNATPSPNMAASTPQMHHNSLSASFPQPARSPSPIPQPATASGGRPPSTLSGQGPVNFGQLTGDGSDQSLRPTGPAHLAQSQHLRRESSQSAHSDMSVNRTFVPGANRAPSNGNPRQFNGPQYQGGPNQIPYSPSNTFRPLAMNRQGSNVSQYQSPGPGQMRGPNSPYPQNRSPAMQPAAMQQPHMHQGPPMPHPYGAYPQHLNPQNPGMYMPQEFNPQQYGYYQQPFMQQQHLQGYPAPPSPQPYQSRGQPPYGMPGNPYSQPQPMSRGSSQNGIGGPDRPSSTLQPTTPSHTPGTPGSSSPAPSQPSFTRPEPRKSKAIVIKRPDGEVVDIKKEAAITSPQPVAPQARGPLVVTSGGVPSSSSPPPRANATTPQHVRTESQQAKSAEEKKAEFAEAIKRKSEQDKAEEVKKEAEKAQKALKEKEAADRKVQEEEAAAKAKEDAAKAKEAADAKAASAESAEEEAARKKKEEDDEFERQIAEMEAEIAAKEKEEEERQRAYEEKKKIAAAEKAKLDAAAADEELKRAEREAEELEESKLKGKTGNDSDAEGAALFAKLKKNTQFGPGAEATESGTSTPRSESPAPQAVQPVQPISSKPATLVSGKGSRPTALKLETNKPVEPALPTAGMQSLKSARFLQVRSESVTYPEGIQSPNPAINQSARSQGRRYDKNFLLQFQQVFKEKPSTEWDKVIKDTVGDSSDSARPGSARTPSMGARSMSNRPASGAMGLGTMGTFTSTGPRTLPPGTSSEQRFQASNLGGGGGGAGRGGSALPNFGQFQPARGAGAFPMGSTGMARTPSSQSMSGQGMNSPRNASSRGKGSRRGNPAQDREMQKKMPLTANMDIAPIVISQTGWKPSVAAPQQQSQPLPGGHLPPDMVQRKVKAALNKMTPEKFDKIANDILQISSQSKDETDGRTLRQVIQLTFEKACDEAHWASMYAKFCKRMLEEMGPEIRDEGVRDKAGNIVVGGALFRKYLLNRCQEEFERGWEVNLPEKPEGQNDEAAMLSDEYYIAAAAKRKGLGLIQFIGELYKLGMLTLRIMHECVVKLLQFQGTPDEAAVESLVKLLKTIGMTMDNDPKGHSMIDTYMERISLVRDQDGLPSRLYYMLLDITDLRKAKWKSKDNEKGPKTITEIHQEAQAAQQAADVARQNAPRGGGGRPQMGRGDARTPSYGMPPPDYPRNQVGMDDLKKLTRNAANRSSGPGALGPSSLLGGSRSGSRRGQLGTMSRGDDSGASSRTGTPPVKEKSQSTAHVNAYDALAALDASGDTADDVASPPSTSSSPQATKAQPAKTPESEAAKAS